MAASRAVVHDRDAVGTFAATGPYSAACSRSAIIETRLPARWSRGLRNEAWQVPLGTKAAVNAAPVFLLTLHGRLMWCLAMDALGIALIIIGVAVVGLTLQRRFLESDEDSSQERELGLDPVERGLLDDLHRLNAMEPAMRNEREDHKPDGETDRSVP